MKTTCIIPAWNEADRLSNVLSCVVGHPLVNEVIVVDDGSTDATGTVAARAGARVIRQFPNAGKSAAVARGLQAAEGDLVLFLDADLSGLTSRHLDDLLSPVLTGQATVSVSLRSNAPLLWRLIGLDYISGERLMPKAMLSAHVPRIARLRGFGLEVTLNEIWLDRRVPIAVVPFAGVASPSKSAKQGVLRGLVSDARMIGDILQTVGSFAALWQIYRMLRARRMSCIRP